MLDTMPAQSARWRWIGRHELDHVPVDHDLACILEIDRDAVSDHRLDLAQSPIRAVGVGYEDPAYFSREYKKHFGAPPQRDIARLRSTLEH